MQTRRRFLSAAIGSAAVLGAVGAALRTFFDGTLTSHRHAAPALGTMASIEAFHADGDVARQAVQEAFDEIHGVEELMSLYRPESALCRLNRDGVLRDPDPRLVEVIRYSLDLSRETDGAFDVTVQPLWTVYAAAKSRHALPKPEDIEQALSRVGWKDVEVSSRHIRMRPGMAITLNGIAQGYAADRAVAALRRHGIEHALVDAGEIGAVGPRPDRGPWNIGIQHPREQDAYISLARLDGRCLSTSGDYATFFTDDRQSNHLFDPRTGRSPDVFSSVSVVAPTAMIADGLSTAISVLGFNLGQELVRSTAGCDALLVLKDGRTFQTSGFPA